MNMSLMNIKNITVLGSGVMGHGIAQVSAMAGYNVALRDIDQKFLDKAMGKIIWSLNKLVEKNKITKQESEKIIGRIKTYVDLRESLNDSDLVIEAVPEDMNLKKKIYAELDKLAPSNTVFASNTSTLPITELSEVTTRSSTFIGIHFFNPVHKMKLVEIVKGDNTSDETVGKAVEFTKRIGKLPVVVKDSPGFLVNRILMPYLIEAVYLSSIGIEVDRVDKLLRDFGMPMGPFRLIDEVGGDVCQHVADDLLARLDTKFPNSNALRKMIENGDFGKKTGKGFYVYKNGRSNGVNAKYKRELKQLPFSDEEIIDRLVLIMVNEAVRCLQEEIVGSPRDIDFGMIMGTGWAPFRGGPMRYLDSEGALNIFNRLKGLEKKHKYFKPCELLSEYSNNDKKFYEET